MNSSIVHKTDLPSPKVKDIIQDKMSVKTTHNKLYFRKTITLYLEKSLTYEEFKGQYMDRIEDLEPRCLKIWNKLCEDADNDGYLDYNDDEDEAEEEDQHMQKLDDAIEENIEELREEFEDEEFCENCGSECRENRWACSRDTCKLVKCLDCCGDDRVYICLDEHVNLEAGLKLA